MDLAAALAGESGGQKRSICNVRLLLDELDAADHAALIAAMADQKLSGAAISRALAVIGHSVRQHTIQRHRRKDCGCGAG